MQKGTTVVYTGGANGGFYRRVTYTVIDYSDLCSQVKVEDDDETPSDF